LSLVVTAVAAVAVDILMKMNKRLGDDEVVK
jgi:hypothetical protein